jgi:hypothetical protein
LQRPDDISQACGTLTVTAVLAVVKGERECPHSEQLPGQPELQTLAVVTGGVVSRS